MPQRLSFGDIPNTTNLEAEQGLPATQIGATPPRTPPPVVFTPPRRAGRTKAPRTVYDASTGTYKPPSSVPDDV